ncbi:Transmembrane protein SKG6 [Cordyceps fumosorosea ARSEF 2679]|uniref:Transmembrane protein SKG6 n=1 Tax=Cordyceps fumosorosea (strain ARSEF 2679) TaxID=1081104 RepID=A0A167LB29_CORFA|nr:Transmembrane protein SKG6 [Cordyceps fumosorosea ARSEF 2679]OAA52871.1 Transmembrane protein SKG6 [Cordyceps fumosorosea ARSEF 2679]
MRQAQVLSKLAAVVVLASPALSATASITSVIPNQAHQCIQLCAWNNYQGNLPVALGCANPYENECYCPTATESVSKASVAIEKCVSSRCAAGDLTRDLTSLRSIYAGYCKDAGYLQDAGALGYTAAGPTASSSEGASSSSSAPTTGQKTDSSQPSKTSAGQSVSTTTQKTTVTQTKASGADGTGSQVVVHETETVIVDGSRGSGSGPSTAVKIGVGVGVPGVALLVIAGVGLLLWRKRRPARRGKLDGVAMEERGGSRQEPGPAARDQGASDGQKQQSTRPELAVKAGATVQRIHEVDGSQRSASYRTQDTHAVAGSQQSDSDAGYSAHEVMGTQRSNFYEADSGSLTRLFEAPGVPGAPSRPINELPASHKQMRQETLSGAG